MAYVLLKLHSGCRNCSFGVYHCIIPRFSHSECNFSCTFLYLQYIQVLVSSECESRKASKSRFFCSVVNQHWSCTNLIFYYFFRILTQTLIPEKVHFYLRQKCVWGSYLVVSFFYFLNIHVFSHLNLLFLKLVS